MAFAKEYPATTCVTGLVIGGTITTFVKRPPAVGKIGFAITTATLTRVRSLVGYPRMMMTTIRWWNNELRDHLRQQLRLGLLSCSVAWLLVAVSGTVRRGGDLAAFAGYLTSDAHLKWLLPLSGLALLTVVLFAFVRNFIRITSCAGRGCGGRRQ